MSKTNKEEPIRIAQIMGKMNGAGVESVVNFIFYKKEFKEVINIFKNMFRRKRRN